LLQNERWSDIDKNKGGRKAFESLQAAFGNVEGWVVTRKSTVEEKAPKAKTEKKPGESESQPEVIKREKEEVRLKTFDEIFRHLAVPQEFLLIQGEEISDKYMSKPIHMCATNTSELLPPIGGESVQDVMQRNIDAAMARRERTGVKTLVHLNHPNFGFAITAEQLMHVVGENFFEVYNGHPTVYNSGDATHASTERVWDIVNTFRLAKLNLPVMYGLATDDGHNYFEAGPGPGKGAQPGRGWVVVLAHSLNPDAIVDSLEAGKFYSSSGVTLEQIQVSGDRFHVSVAAQEGLTYRVDFIGTRKTFNDQSEAVGDDPVKAAELTRRYSDDIGAVLKSVEGTSAEYQFDGTELYVRAVVTSSRVHPNPSEAGEFERAWVQPVVRSATE
jgi:hypothetical protein